MLDTDEHGLTPLGATGTSSTAQFREVLDVSRRLAWMAGQRNGGFATPVAAPLAA